MKKVIGLLLAVMTLACVSCSKKIEKGEFTVQKGKYMVGMEIGYPPFEYYADDGSTPMGFDVLLGKEIAKRLGLEAEFIDTAWDGIFAGLDTDRYDVVMSAATITPERVANYDFSTPYIGNGQAIILRKDSTLNITKFEDLASTSALIKNAKKAGLGVDNGLALYKLYDEKNPLALKVIGEFYHYLAIGIANLVYIFNPEAIMIGGGISNRETLTDEIKVELKKILQPEFFNTITIENSIHKNEGGLIGAYFNAVNKLNTMNNRKG